VVGFTLGSREVPGRKGLWRQEEEEHNNTNNNNVQDYLHNIMMLLKWAHNANVPPYISSIKEVQVPDEPVPSLFELDLLTIPASS
jgi:hypothetical protein